MLNLAYTWTDMIGEKASSGSPSDKNYAQFLLLVYSIVTTIACGIWIGYQFYWYGQCAEGITNMIVLVVFVIFFYITALVKLCDVDVFRQNSNIFTVSLVTSYMSYLVWTAMASHPDPTCNPFTLNSGNTIA